MTQLIRTVVVDDSAFVRKIVREMLSRTPFIEVVGTARDGEEALEMVEALKPDVVTCDLTMPILDGVGFVRKQMARRPVPILILTASPQDGEQVLEALQAGAVDLVQKPTALATDELLAIRQQLVEKVKAAAGAPVGNFLPTPAAVAVAVPAAEPGCRGAVGADVPGIDVVVIGISTGGPQALRRLIPELPADFPVPIAMVLHMPIGYTALFAEKLNDVSALKVVEARHGEVLRPGVALLAPAGRHLSLRRLPDGSTVAHLSMQPLEKTHRPAADVLFQSAAETFGARVLGIVMTGMGEDGKEGAGWIKAQGGTIFTEAESSCIIYGMPRSVVEAGLSDRVVPLSSMASAILEHL
jgi:two-component system, chemotaxis family, protein-glutamate methylesterase/glutaminase